MAVARDCIDCEYSDGKYDDWDGDEDVFIDIKLTHYFSLAFKDLVQDFCMTFIIMAMDDLFSPDNVDCMSGDM